jgi:uncharacterized RDD family membrane protein YckC
MRYWLSIGDGKSYGPYMVEELIGFQREGRVGPGAMLCAEGTEQWIAAAQILGGAIPPSVPHSAAATAGGVAYAGFWLRVVALIIDFVVLAIPSFMLGFVVGLVGVAANLDPALTNFLAQVVGLVTTWLYGAILESSPMQGTVGKMALGLKVTDLDGNRIGFGRASGRAFAKILSGCALFIGYIMAAFTPRKQGLHDMIAGTLVVRK